MTHAYVALRDLHADGGPDAPESWERVQQTPTSWSITPPGEVAIEAKRVNAVGGRGLFVLIGTQAQLEAIAAGTDEVAPAREVWRLAQASAGKARTVALHWRTWRCTLDSGDGPVEGRHELIAEGESLTWEALPWVLPVGTVTAIVRPALGWTLAGMGSDAVCEDEPDRGA